MLISQKTFVMGKHIRKINDGDLWAKIPFRIEPFTRRKEEIVFAQMLSDLERFYEDIKKIREQIKLEKFIPYPKYPTPESLFTLKMSLIAINQKTLEINTKNLAKQIGVEYPWDFSLEILVLTNTLPVFEHTPFILYNPVQNIPLSFIGGVEGKPAIFFKSKFSFDSLKRWIKENKPLLNEITKDLPNQPNRKNNTYAFFIQRAIFFCKEYLGKKSSELVSNPYSKEDDCLTQICKAAGKKPPPDYSYKDIDDNYNRYKRYLLGIYK